MKKYCEKWAFLTFFSQIMPFFLKKSPRIGDFSPKIAYPTPSYKMPPKPPIPRQILHCGTGDSLKKTKTSKEKKNLLRMVEHSCTVFNKSLYFLPRNGYVWLLLYSIIRHHMVDYSFETDHAVAPLPSTSSYIAKINQSGIYL